MAMDDKVDELIRRNRTLLALAKGVRTRTQALINAPAAQSVIGQHASPNLASEDQEQTARHGQHASPETPT
jgi:hypothetical protein